MGGGILNDSTFVRDGYNRSYPYNSGRSESPDCTFSVTGGSLTGGHWC